MRYISNQITCLVHQIFAQFLLRLHHDQQFLVDHHGKSDADRLAAILTGNLAHKLLVRKDALSLQEPVVIDAFTSHLQLFDQQ